MSGTIKIANLKGISELVFSIPQSGLHLISGSNGSGKTTLLACLQRICDGYAFASHFPSNEADILDDHSQAQITYSINGDSVTYRRGGGGKRWVPSPRNKAGVLANFGYPQVIYAGATAERITPHSDEINAHRIRGASNDLIRTLNRIFDTEKFSDLKYVNLSTGNGNQAYLLKVGDRPAKYHTERNFGLGELCILKLAIRINNCPNNSLIIIDEIEMALHPKAQILFLGYLKEISEQKNLTVIVSTHSSSLIKFFGKQHLIYLERDDDSVTVIPKCPPSYALGSLGYGEERAPDVLVYVEDEVARVISESLCRAAATQKYGGRPNEVPTVQFMEIGGYPNIFNMMIKKGGLVPPHTKIRALFDADVRDETLVEARQRNDLTLLQKFDRFNDSIGYLPWSPENGVADFAISKRHALRDKLREKYNNNLIQVNFDEHDYPQMQDGGSKRKAAKRLLGSLVENLDGMIPNDSQSEIQKQVLTIFSEWYFAEKKAEVMQIFGHYV
ncbi:ATP-dependent nuclease [Pseudovibrio ascidiaceicola]|uniref:ATP-dependent nuclease n=1 Tax=Pseudovibrio ascidiaceicola TaxID=285279 RepID=UPI000D6A0081|nr:AAA family ATPase [Pseudovibrio ascidiaceicola]